MRKKYFQLTNLKGKYFFLPNFPSKRFYSRFKTCNIDKSTIKLIYQGAVNGGHGLELCLEMCTRKINGKKVELHVAGPSNKPYLKHLRDLAEQYKVSSQFYYHGLIPYNSLPHLTSSCQIGIGINIPSRIIYKTGGTASNKIYEYAALGLPVLYYDDAHYKEHLKSFEWAKPVKLNLLSLNNVIEEVDLNYEKLSFEANNAFLERLNFEVNFEKVIRHLKEIIEYKYTLKKRDT